MSDGSERMPAAEAPPDVSRKSATLSFMRYLRKEAGVRLSFALVFQILGGLSEGLSIFLLIPIIRRVSDPQSASFGGSVPIVGPALDAVTGSLELSLIVFTFLIIAKFRLVKLSSLYTAKLLFELVDTVRNRLFESIAAAQWMRVASFRASDLNYTLTSDIDRINMAIFHTLSLTQSLVMLLVYCVTSAAISPTMTLFAVAMGAFLIVCVLPLRRRAERLGREIAGKRINQHGTVADFLNGVKLAKTMNVEQSYIRRLQISLEEIQDLSISFIKTQNTSTFWFQVSGAMAVSIFAYVALQNFDVPVERLIVLILLYSRIAPLFNGIQSALQQIAVNVHAFTNMTAIKAQCDAQREQLTGGRAPSFKSALMMSNVSVTYPGQTEPALKGVDIRIEAGKATAIIGPSGGGKSTLADVLIGLLDPTSGTITADGVAIDAVNRRAWRDQIAYVSQDVFMLNDTIYENLRFGRPEADDASVWRALEMAQAKGFVERLPQGVHTEIGERGFKLSGGERQRIALARALMREPQLLVLDEATSALDWQSQSLVAKAVSELRGRITIVTIAHRPSMISFADDVIVLRHGEVVESGHFDELKADVRSHLAAMLTAENTSLCEPDAVRTAKS